MRRRSQPSCRPGASSLAISPPPLRCRRSQVPKWQTTMHARRRALRALHWQTVLDSMQCRLPAERSWQTCCCATCTRCGAGWLSLHGPATVCALRGQVLLAERALLTLACEADSLQVGAASHHYAELAGRSETNAVDVVRAAGGWGLVGWSGTCARLEAMLLCCQLVRTSAACAAMNQKRTLPAAACPDAKQAMALNDMGTSIGQLRDFMHNSSVSTAAAPHTPRATV